MPGVLCAPTEIARGRASGGDREAGSVLAQITALCRSAATLIEPLERHFGGTYGGVCFVCPYNAEASGCVVQCAMRVAERMGWGVLTR
ncbi:unnamed protein product [Phytomonas sp. Hart1]|nr:unnamed protein product [Phytomonas sp. Hart1]|eukprot:CCW69829.1 unnamed protein product [Phytomonas sp. isolate Hart1]